MGKIKTKPTGQKCFDTFVPINASPLSPDGCVRFFVLRADEPVCKPAKHLCQKKGPAARKTE